MMALKAKDEMEKTTITEIHFINDDCFNCEWHATVLFLPITCFTPEMVVCVCEKMKTVQKGCLILCTSTLTPLDDDSLCGATSLKRLSKTRIRYGKGTMEFTVYEKIS